MDLLQTVRKEGSRGGRAEFSWSDVKGHAQRESYLGHSLMAPVGRWQKGKDLNWYARADDNGQELSEADKRKEEMRRIKQREEDEMLRALGMPVPDRENANLEELGTARRMGDVQGLIKEVMKEDGQDGGAEEGVKGLGFGKSGAGKEGREAKRERRRSRSRSRDRRRRSDAEERPRRRRSRSHDREKERHRERERDRDRDSRRVRPRSRSADRDRKYRPRRDEQDREDRHRRSDRRSRSRSRDRRRHRTRSPEERDRRRRTTYD